VVGIISVRPRTLIGASRNISGAKSIPPTDLASH